MRNMHYNFYTVLHITRRAGCNEIRSRLGYCSLCEAYAVVIVVVVAPVVVVIRSDHIYAD